MRDHDWVRIGDGYWINMAHIALVVATTGADQGDGLALYVVSGEEPCVAEPFRDLFGRDADKVREWLNRNSYA